MNTLSKFVLTMFFITSIGLAVVVGQNLRDNSNDLETVPATDTAPVDNNTNENEIVCTLDIKICPDGSEVSRDPNSNCEFSQCPGQEVIPVCGNGICEESELQSCNGTCPAGSFHCPQDCTDRDTFNIKPGT